MTRDLDSERRPTETAPREARRCPGCRTKIVIWEDGGLVVKNAVLRVGLPDGRASAKCPRCKTWVEVPLAYRD